MNEIFITIKKALKNARNALIVSHVDPDGDSIGSMNAMGLVLAQMGLAVDQYSQDGVPKIYRFLPGSDSVKNKVEQNKKYDLLIAVDASDIKRLGDKLSVKDIAKLIINIDHHPDNTQYGDINYAQKSSSTAELVYKLLKNLKIKIDKPVAENLYVALITDTGNYRYENTSVGTFIMAEDMLKAGVDTHAITTRIYDTKSIASIRIQAAALSTLEVSPDRKAAWVVVTQEMMEKVGAKGDDIVGLVDQIRSIDGIEVAILFREDGSKVKVNLRSKSKINVSEIARRFDGGGHFRAAGAILSDDIVTAKKKVVAEVLKYLKASKYLV
ncbi:MAG: bifunctional oligoribonuclease/PAP phosphatase NrnA [Candidatus Margulisbacteria bacterium]|nr:bifunctional oligoribonuclease/PAP phosphatase NrnA [Candidatus Margulisiibacteriota bacterium]